MSLPTAGRLDWVIFKGPFWPKKFYGWILCLMKYKLGHVDLQTPPISNASFLTAPKELILFSPEILAVSSHWICVIKE